MKREKLEAALQQIKSLQGDLANIHGANPLYYKLRGFQQVVATYIQLFEFNLKTEDFLLDLDRTDVTVYDILSLIEKNVTNPKGTQTVKLNEQQRTVLRHYLPHNVANYTVNDVRNAILLALMNEYFTSDIITKVDHLRTTYDDITMVSKKNLEEVVKVTLRSFIWTGHLIAFYLGLERNSTSRMDHIFLQASKVAWWGVGYVGLIALSVVKDTMMGNVAIAVHSIGLLHQLFTVVFPLLVKSLGSITKTTFNYLFGTLFTGAEKRLVYIKEKEVRRILQEVARVQTESSKTTSTGPSSKIFYMHDPPAARAPSRAPTRAPTRAPAQSTKFYSAKEKLPSLPSFELKN